MWATESARGVQPGPAEAEGLGKITGDRAGPVSAAPAGIVPASAHGRGAADATATFAATAQLQGT